MFKNCSKFRLNTFWLMEKNLTMLSWLEFPSKVFIFSLKWISELFEVLLQLLYQYSNHRNAINQLDYWGLTNKALQERLGMQASSISYHLQELWSTDLRESILRKRETELDNRSKLYYLEPPILNALEISFWGLKSKY